MSKLYLILIGLCAVSFRSFSADCILKQDTLYYIEIDIRSSSNYPIIMAGVIEGIDIISFSKENLDDFLKSFYNKCYYVPDLYKGYPNMIIECMGVHEGNSYLNTHKNEGEKIMNLLSKNSIKGQFLLNSGETVFVNVVQISASFWVVSKDSKGLVTNSNEININSIEEIKEVYVPFKIDCYKKPRQKNLKIFSN